ncbi:MAG: sensor histidine kinase [Solirubrobacteraceae bacterium]
MRDTVVPGRHYRGDVKGTLARREAVLALIVAAVMVLGLLSVFAVELADTQAKSRRDVTTRVHERALLAAALLDSLFQTTSNQVPQYTRTYGARHISEQTLARSVGENHYLAMLDQRGDVLAGTPGLTAQARSDLKISAALALVRSGRPYGLGNLLPYGSSGVVNFAVAFPTRFGTRILLSGIRPALLGQFITGELRRIPGVKGAHSYLLDGNHTVLASTSARRPTGFKFSTPAQLSALAHGSGDVRGHYYDQVPLANSTWKVLLSAPDGPLFASVTGLRKWIPWLIFIAFAVVALVALVFAVRALRAADEVRDAKARLEEANQELERANDRLRRHAQELTRSNADLEQFASIASHDLQEPLRKVRTFTEQLTVLEGDALSAKGRDYLERTAASAARMQNLIEDLLRFSRVATHGRPFAPVDLHVVAAEVIDDLEAQVELAGALIHLAELPTIVADPLQMRQLLQNLISNAIKFHRANMPPEVWITSERLDDHVQITVRDNGIGFEAQYARRIFRVFERLHGRSEYAGTGIGLALCRKIVERHGGSIVADADPGEGATFTVTLPLRQAAEYRFGPPAEHVHAVTEREGEHVPA